MAQASNGNLSPAELLLFPVRAAFQNSFLWVLFFLVLAGAGIVVQITTARQFEAETYTRLAEPA